MESKVPLASRDLQDPQVQLVPLETRVILVLVESKVPLAPKDLKDPQVQLVPLETREIEVRKSRSPRSQGCSRIVWS